MFLFLTSINMAAMTSLANQQLFYPVGFPQLWYHARPFRSSSFFLVFVFGGFDALPSFFLVFCCYCCLWAGTLCLFVSLIRSCLSLSTGKPGP